MNLTLDQFLAVLSAVGGGSAITLLLKGIGGYWTGHAQKQKEHNQDLATQRDRAWELVEGERKRADAADARADRIAQECEDRVREANIRKRQALELASCYRGTLMRNGIDVGPWPDELK